MRLCPHCCLCTNQDIHFPTVLASAWISIIFPTHCLNVLRLSVCTDGPGLPPRARIPLTHVIVFCGLVQCPVSDHQPQVAI